MLCGFAAGGRAGNISDPPLGPVALLAGRLVGGVGLGVFEEEDAEGTQGTVETLVLCVF